MSLTLCIHCVRCDINFNNATHFLYQGQMKWTVCGGTHDVPLTAYQWEYSAWFPVRYSFTHLLWIMAWNLMRLPSIMSLTSYLSWDKTVQYYILTQSLLQTVNYKNIWSNLWLFQCHSPTSIAVRFKNVRQYYLAYNYFILHQSNIGTPCQKLSYLHPAKHIWKIASFHITDTYIGISCSLFSIMKFFNAHFMDTSCIPRNVETE